MRLIGGRLQISLLYGVVYRGVHKLHDDARDRWYCPRLHESFVARLEGVTATVVEPGWRCAIGGMSEPLCITPAFDFDVPSSLPAGATVELGDDSYSSTVDVSGP